MPDCAPIVTVVRGRTLSLRCPHRSHLLTSCGSGDLLKSEFITFVSFHDIENSWTNKKPPTIKARRFQSSGGVFVQRVYPLHIRRDFHSHPRHRGLHCPVAGLLFGVALDVALKIA